MTVKYSIIDINDEIIYANLIKDDIDLEDIGVYLGISSLILYLISAVMYELLTADIRHSFTKTNLKTRKSSDMDILLKMYKLSLLMMHIYIGHKHYFLFISYVVLSSAAMGFTAYKLKSYYNSYYDVCVIAKMFIISLLAVIYGIGMLLDDAGAILLLSVILVPIILYLFLGKLNIKMQQLHTFQGVYGDQNKFEINMRNLLSEKSDEKYDFIIQSFNEIHKTPSIRIDKLFVA